MPDIIVESPTGLKKLVFHNRDKSIWFIVPAGTILSEGSLEVHCNSTIPRRFQVEPMSISLHKSSPLGASWQMIVNLVVAIFIALALALGFRKRR